MTEIDKMYENAGIEPIDSKLEPMRTLRFSVDDIGTTWTREQYMEEVPIYPPFTAEKQLELIKWLSDTDYYIHNIYKTIDTKEYCIENYYYDMQTDKFEETLAKLINKMWLCQDLTDQEKDEIRKILNE